jgi:hypothetical protein
MWQAFGIAGAGAIKCFSWDIELPWLFENVPYFLVNH